MQCKGRFRSNSRERIGHYNGYDARNNLVQNMGNRRQRSNSRNRNDRYNSAQVESSQRDSSGETEQEYGEFESLNDLETLS